MVFSNYPRLNKLLRVIGESHLRESLVAVVAIFVLGLGSSLIVAPDQAESIAAYQAMSDLISPYMWGGALIVTDLWLCLAVIRSKQSGMWPALVLTIMFGTLTMANVVTSGDNAIPAFLWLHMFAAMVCGLLTASCAVYREVIESHEAD